MHEFVGLRAKLYSYKMYEGDETKSARESSQVWLRKRLLSKTTRTAYLEGWQTGNR